MKQQKDGIRARLLEFFRRNPDEFLTTTDVQLKFGGAQSAIRVCVCDMRKRGELGPGPFIRRPQ